MKNLKIFIPGLLVAATGVGAGDLITGALAGHYLGLLLWVPLLGALLKYVLTEGIARYQYSTGETLIHGWMNTLGKGVKYPFLIYLIIWSFMVGGALVNAAGSSVQNLFPILHGKVIYGTGLSLFTVALLRFGRYEIFEKIMTILIACMFITVIGTSFTFIDNIPEFLLGFFKVKPDTFSNPWFLGVLGGVGGTLTILCYGYWINESDRKGMEGLKTTKIDLFISYLLTGLFSLSMMILGSKLTEIDRSGPVFVQQVSQLFAQSLGPSGVIIFKVGFFCGVYSSLLGVWQSVPYLYADLYFLHRQEKVEDLKGTKVYKVALYAIATIPLLSTLIKFQAIQLLYAVIGALFIPLCAVSLLILNNKKERGEFKNSLATNLLLGFTLLFFLGNGIKLIVEKF
ncbi:MAG: Nramp family divalent metal transporter [Halobacteriovoraceae bacterium]|nr:Nramp family divalent metal transporter [Halobacteriovoraceae bacterium]